MTTPPQPRKAPGPPRATLCAAVRPGLLVAAIVLAVLGLVGAQAWSRFGHQVLPPATPAPFVAAPPPTLRPVAPPPEAPSPPHLGWTATSWSGHARLVHGATAPTACHARCEVDGGVTWAVDACLGEDGDLPFVSGDCAVAVVLQAYPEVSEALKLTRVGTVVAAGQPPKPVLLGQLMPRLTGLRPGARRVRWLAGVLGEPGNSPHLSGDGLGVVLSTLDGATHTVAFADFPRLPTLEPLHAAERADPGGLFTFTDDEGSLQVVQGLGAVPERFRRRAQPVTGTVSAMEGPKATPRAPGSPSFADFPPSTPGPRPSPSAPPPGDGVYRNERGENWLEYNRRLSMPRFPTTRVRSGPIRTCAEAGASCRSGADCCAGTCSSGTCGAASACGSQGEACARPQDCCSGACTGGRCP